MIKLPYCPKCGTELRPNAKFCHRCGGEVELDLYLRTGIASQEPKILEGGEKPLSGLVEERWKKKVKSISDVAIASEASCVAVGSGRIIHILDFEGNIKLSIKAEGSVNRIAVTSDCSKLFAATPRFLGAGKVCMYRIRGQKELEVKMAEKIRGLAISSDGEIILAISENFVQVWNQDGNVLLGFKSASSLGFVLGTQAMAYISAAVTPNGSHIVWTEAPTEATGSFVNINVWLFKTPDINTLLKIGDERKRTKQWLTDYTKLAELPLPGGSVRMTNNLIAVASSGSIYLFNTKGDKVLDHKAGALAIVAITSDERYIFYGTEDERLCLFEVESRTTREIFNHRGKGIRAGGISADGSKVVLASNKEITMWNVS